MSTNSNNSYIETINGDLRVRGDLYVTGTANTVNEVVLDDPVIVMGNRQYTIPRNEQDGVGMRLNTIEDGKDAPPYKEVADSNTTGLVGNAGYIVSTEFSDTQVPNYFRLRAIGSPLEWRINQDISTDASVNFVSVGIGNDNFFTIEKIKSLYGYPTTQIVVKNDPKDPLPEPVIVNGADEVSQEMPNAPGIYRVMIPVGFGASPLDLGGITNVRNAPNLRPMYIGLSGRRGSFQGDLYELQMTNISIDPTEGPQASWLVNKKSIGLSFTFSNNIVRKFHAENYGEVLGNQYTELVKYEPAILSLNVEGKPIENAPVIFYNLASKSGFNPIDEPYLNDQNKVYAVFIGTLILN